MRHIFYDSLKSFLMVFVATLAFVAPTFAATLPTGYTELEYIQSSGTQYIDTNVIPDSAEVRIETSVVPKAISETINMILGTVEQSSFDAFVLNNQTIYLGGNNDCVYNTGASIKDKTVVYNGVFSTTSPRRNLYGTIDGTAFSKTTDTNPIGTTSITTPIRVFGHGSSYTGAMQMHYLKVYKNGVLALDLIPAKNSSGVVGMYDTVNGVFYTNRGTGTFTAGPIACNGTRVNYTTATGTVTQNGTPTPTNPITPTFYTQGDMVLRKINDTYKDTYDATTGKITRRVGVKVIDGTENWHYDSKQIFYASGFFPINIVDDYTTPISTHYRGVSRATTIANTPNMSIKSGTASEGKIVVIKDTDKGSDVTSFKTWLAEQYAAGTPVTVYYPLTEAVEEDWAAEQCVQGIKIATTKYTEDAFANLVTTLNSAITKVTNIVDTTVQQATEIGNLATTKQDRPETDCPAGRKCLLIMGADNKPHWYLIQE